MNPLIELLTRSIAFLCRWVLYLTLSVTFLILTINVVLRYANGSGLTWASELPELLFPWMIMAGVVLAAQHGSHIAVVILTQRLGAARRWTLAAGTGVVAALYAGLAGVSWPLLQVAADERSPMMGVPGSVSVACLMLGFAMLGITALGQLPAVWRGVSADGADAPDTANTAEGASA